MLGGVVGRDRITGLRTHGGMGAVPAAGHALLGRPVTVKLLPRICRAPKRSLALGCILSKLCPGRAPFLGDRAGDALAAHVHVQVLIMASPTTEIPAAAERLVPQQLARQPQDRVQTVELPIS